MIALLLATVLMGAFGVVVRFGQRRNGDTTAIGTVNYVVAALCFIPFLEPLTRPDISGRTLLIGAVGGLLYPTAYFLLPPVLRAKGVAVASAAMRVSVIIPMLLALLLWQEVPTALQGTGAVLALAALPMLAAGRQADQSSRKNGSATLALMLLFIVNGGCAAVNKVYHVVGRAAERPAYLMILFGVAAVYTFTGWVATSRRLSLADTLVGVVLGLVNASANFALLAALDAYSAVVVFPVTAAGGLVFAVVFAAVAWKEWPTRWGQAGVALALAAVVMVNLANDEPSYREPMLPAGTTEASPFGEPDHVSLPTQEGTEESAMPEERRDLSELWDIEAIATGPLRREVLRERALGWGDRRIETRDVRYYSHAWAEGDVTIAAHIAIPAKADGPVPAMVMGTGDADSADAFSRAYGVAAIVFDRPGTGESTGPEDLYSNWVQFTDPREGWMWHYVTAALRAVTLATTLPEVDPERIGITGYSRGGTMAWIANGVDPRLKLAIPVATGGDIVRALDHGGWANYIHRDESGQAYIPNEFYEFAKIYDPMLYCGRQHGAVALVVGAQDEYFPLYCTATSAKASEEDEFLLLVIANWDHGYFAGDNPHVDAFDNSREATEKRERLIRAAIDCRLKGNGTMPKMPGLAMSRVGDRAYFAVSADHAGEVERVVIQASIDGAYTFEELPTEPEGDGFAAEFSGPDSAVLAGMAAYAEVAYVGGPVLTSAPVFGEAFEQRMRPFPEPEE